MALLTKRKAIAIKAEASEGVPESLAAANVVYAENIKFTPNTEMLKRNPHLATLSQEPPLPGRSYGKVSWDMPLIGSASAGAAPHWSVPLLSCGFAETLVGGTSAKYLPISTSIPSCTIKYFEDGVSYQLRGCRGNVSRKNGPGDVPRLSFEFTGLWDPDVEADAVKDETFLSGNAFPAFNPSSFRAALCSKDTTSMLIMKSLSWNMNNKLLLEPSANTSSYRSVQITGRDPQGSIDHAAVLQATLDFERLCRRATPWQLRGYTGASDSGSGGVGSLNTLTDSGKLWVTNQFASGYKLVDSAGTVFTPTANTKTAVTVSGTPANGSYLIYVAGKLVRETMPKVVITAINGGDEGGVNWKEMPFAMARNASDDEIELWVI